MFLCNVLSKAGKAGKVEIVFHFKVGICLYYEVVSDIFLRFGFGNEGVFIIGISKLDSKEVKDPINLTFNLNHFTLCQDVSNYGKTGREHVLNTEGAVPAHDENDPKYAAIGKELINKGLA